jgi:iron complex transport system substrate-binding protein
VDANELAALGPEVVVVKPCGFSLERALAERAIVERSVRQKVKAARIYVSDGNAFFNRPGPRLVESLEIMAACIHPEIFPDFAAKHATEIVRL